MSELSILIPDETISLRHGINLSMRPCQVKQLKEILGVISRYVDKIAETDDTIELAKYLLADSGEQGLKDIYLILRNVISIPTEVLEKLDFDEKDNSEDKKDNSKDKKDILFDNLLYDELVLLVVKFLEMNKDFFKRIGSKLKPVTQEQNSKVKTGASK